MSLQSLSDMNVIEAEYETVAIEDSAALVAKREAKLNSQVVCNEICAIVSGVPMVVTILVSLGTLSSGLVLCHAEIFC
jgi:hypothetical protein